MSEKSYKDYLNKTFLEELNYKIWTTKACRFNASSRLVKTNKLSNFAINIISVYLTIAGLLTVYNINSKIIDDNLLAYLITSLSIITLVFGQIESSKDYTLKAKEFHNCGLELSYIYNKLRIFKTLEINPTPERKIEFTEEISDSYQKILEKYENHLPIDNKIFKAKNAKYHELNWIDVAIYHSEHYVRTYFIYHFLIFTPALLIGALVYYRN
ncbi:SLATT domain-containing protein [Elizabethkingia sp. HX XZB]|uniref:SLATT domain-containing protein n=1 Tax=Elizabethkingia sp. HX XZB TaxID=3003193 RepID=UPI002A24D9A6|nr:SLATT domain-containing protein [Elizabethkingia sp. HX XZB]MDX8567357.1 SLATT domain-containing protein [Elizabethkingia sp. HX XZB]